MDYAGSSIRPTEDFSSYSAVSQSVKQAADEAADDLFKMERSGELNLDSDSVYGLAIAMPQIARSHPNKIFVSLAIRSYLLLGLNIYVQFALLEFVGQATQIMPTLGGQMHLCDFGATLETCPGGVGCVGPGGTKFTKLRLYGYTQWAIQKFVKQALLDVVPERTDLINEKVDPGEFGMENYWCRLYACFLFAMSVITELYSCFELFGVLWNIPSNNESWIGFKERESSGNSSSSTFPALDFVNFQVAGMSHLWKLINICTVLVPKVFLWVFVVWQGFILLMESAGILDLVLGSLAMSFICSIDEMILSSLSSKAARHIMDSLDPFEVVDHGHQKRTTLQLLWFTFPRRLALVICITVFFITKYYMRKCRWDPDLATWISIDMSYPTKVTYLFWDLFDADLIPMDKEKFWTMPPVSE